jgi:ketosteroid isomerase-like protein
MASALNIATLSLAAALLASCATTRQEPQADVAAINAADQAFYSALTARSIDAMAAVWADKPYVISIGPRSKTMDVGSAAVKRYWAGAFDFFPQINVAKSDTRIQTDGKLAWVVGIEHAVLQPKTGGEPLRFDTFVTHVFENDNGHWLLVSHHAQMIPR